MEISPLHLMLNPISRKSKRERESGHVLLVFSNRSPVQLEEARAEWRRRFSKQDDLVWACGKPELLIIPQQYNP